MIPFSVCWFFCKAFFCAFIIQKEMLSKGNQIGIYMYAVWLCSDLIHCIQNEKKSAISLNSVNHISEEWNLECI